MEHAHGQECASPGGVRGNDPEHRRRNQSQPSGDKKYCRHHSAENDARYVFACALPFEDRQQQATTDKLPGVSLQ